MVWASSPHSTTANLVDPDQAGVDPLGPTLIERDDEAGFNFPYYLYSPENAREKPMLVEPVNSGACDDDFQTDLDAAEDTVTSGVARQVCDELRIPLIVPVFANPCEGEFWNRFIQALDTATLHIDSGRFERIDLQLLRMIDDAQQRLASHGLDLPETVMLNGFSASGNFVNNFAALHPDRIASVTAGAVNGMATLPVEEAQGYTVNYQIGIADLDALTGSAFAVDSWRAVPQLCYMGGDESSPEDDTLPYRDVWSEEQAAKARSVYGDDMQTERMVYSESVYKAVDAAGRFEVYDDTGHSYSDEIVDDIISFHRRHNDIESASFVTEPAGGMESVSANLFMSTDESEQFVARVFVNGSDLTADSAVVPSNAPTDVTVELTEPLSVGDAVSLAVLESADSEVSQASLTVETTVTAKAHFSTAPGVGDTDIEVSAALDDSAASSATLSIVPDGPGQFWRRRIHLTNLDPGDSLTETYQLETGNEGVPFESGDEVQLWLIPSGNQVRRRAHVIDSVVIGEPSQEEPIDRFTPSACDDDVVHEQVDVAFATRPSLGDDTVTVDVDVDASFEQEARIRLFPETGGGPWGVGLGWVEPDTESTQTYEISPNLLTLGETVDVRVFPEDWGQLEDVIATDCATVDGVRFAETPVTGASELTITYYYHDRFDDPGTLEFTVNDTVVSSITTIEPGTFERRAVSIDPVPGEATVAATLYSAVDTEVASDTYNTRPADIATVDVVESPSVADNHLSIEYELSADYAVDRFCILRLYHASSSSWGIFLKQMEPGDSGSETVSISVDEPGVPFKEDAELDLALVDWDDPYATRPLAQTTVTVGEPIEEPDGYEVQIRADEGGTTDPAPQRYTYSNGEEVTITAKPDPGWEFVGWAGDIERTDPEIEITVDEELELVAEFERKEYDVMVDLEGEGETTLEEGVHTYEYGEELDIEAIPASGWTFVGWTGDVTAETQTLEIPVEQELTVVAEFERKEFELTVEIEGEGATSVPEGVHTYEYEEEVVIEADPEAGWVFAGWRGGVDSDAETVRLVMDENKTVIAEFSRQSTPTPSDPTATPEESPTPPPASPSTQSPTEGDSIPGFGWLAGVSTLGGVSYVLKRHLTDDTDADDSGEEL